MLPNFVLVFDEWPSGNNQLGIINISKQGKSSNRDEQMPSINLHYGLSFNSGSLKVGRVRQILTFANG